MLREDVHFLKFQTYITYMEQQKNKNRLTDHLFPIHSCIDTVRWSDDLIIIKGENYGCRYYFRRRTRRF